MSWLRSRNNHKKAVNEPSIGDSKAIHMLRDCELEASASAFSFAIVHKKPEPRFRNLFTEIDVIDSDRGKLKWDLRVTYPFKISNEDDLKLRQVIKDFFEKTKFQVAKHF